MLRTISILDLFGRVHVCGSVACATFFNPSCIFFFEFDSAEGFLRFKGFVFCSYISVCVYSGFFLFLEEMSLFYALEKAGGDGDRKNCVWYYGYGREQR